MIDTMFQEGTDKALDDLVRRPVQNPAPLPSFSAWGMFRGAGKGVGGGTAEGIAFGAEIAGAFGQVEGSLGAVNAGGMFSLAGEAERKQQEQARNKLVIQGIDFSNPVGDAMRQRAKELMPDPATTHTAEQVTAGLANFATKAVAYTFAAGPSAPLALGGDAGLTEADKLKQEGVDLATRTKVGAVAGAIAGASIVLPVVGGTALKTAGLVAAAGPGSFVAQNATTRAILQNANYEKLGEQYDPFDPVGLTLSTLVPAAFGAAAMRGAARAAKAPPTVADVVLGIESGGRRYGADGKLLTSPKGAQGEMQVMPKTATDPGFGVAPARDSSPDELARVGRDYLAAMQQRYGDTDKALAAYNAGPGAVDEALKKGGDWLSRLPQETRDYVSKGMERLEGAAAHEQIGAAVRDDPELVAAARVAQVAEHMDALRLTRDDDLGGMAAHHDAIGRAHDQIAAGERVDVSDVLGGRALDGVRAQQAIDQYSHMFGDMEQKYQVPQASQATMRTTPAGMPDIKTPSIHLTDATPTTRMEHVGQPGDELTRFAIRDNDGHVMGHTDLLLRDGKVVSLYDVETTPGLRGKGIGAKVIEAITSLEPDRKIEISNIVDDAVPFWEKVGAQVSDGNRSPTLDWHQFAESHAGRSRGATRRGEGMAGHVEAADPGAAEGAGRAPLAGEARELTPEEAAAFGFPTEAPAAKGPVAEVTPGQAAIDRTATEVAALHPDMLVQLEGMDAPARVGDLLEQARKEAADHARDAHLVDIAANCFLRN